MYGKQQISIVFFLVTVLIVFLSMIASYSENKSLNQITDVASLKTKVNDGNEGDTVFVGRGIFELEEPLKPKPGMSIIGAGNQKTIITAVSSWKPSIQNLPKTENPKAYLFDLNKVTDINISNLKLTGGNLHGAIYANNVDRLELNNLQLENFLWSSIRTFSVNNFKVHDNVFVNAGGKHLWTGGAIYMDWTRNSEFWNNKIYSSADYENKFYGFKGRQGENLRFHHNDVGVNFSFEFPFENDRGIEIDHNKFAGLISIPKYEGGQVLENELAYHIHHNWLQKSYALEWARNSVEVNNNFFDFETEDDGGNLISNHGKVSAPGFTLFHDNYIKNPGRGLFWSKGIYNQFYFYNNYVKSNTLTKSEGFFSFNPSSDFDTIVIKNNIIENTEQNLRPLMRNEASYAATIENNTLINISDTSAYENRNTGEPRGIVDPLDFKVGVNGEYTVRNGDILQTP